MNNEELFVDKYNLDTDAAEQPQLYMECVEAIEVVKAEVDELELELEEAIADMDLDIRNQPAAFGLDDVKERAVKSIISKNKNIKSLRRELNTAKRKLAVLNGRKEALDQRKQMIRVLAELYLGEYYVTVEVKSDATHKMRKKLGRRQNVKT